MQCQRCAGKQFVKAGRDRAGRQIYQCATGERGQTARSTSAFRGYRFPDDLIALAVRWYLRFRLPYADMVELLAERGAHVDASTVFDGRRAQRARGFAQGKTHLAPRPPRGSHRTATTGERGA